MNAPPSRPDAKSSSSESSRNRISWVDATKTLAIVLIVAYHVSSAGVGRLLEERGDWANGWADFNQALVPVRIPLFFLVAGLLARSRMTENLNLTARRRVIDLLWVFVTWSAIFSLVYGPVIRPDSPIAGIGDSFSSIPLGGNAYWFLFALPVFYLATRPLVRLPLLALTAGALVYLFSSLIAGIPLALGVDDGAVALRRLSVFWFFYVVGATASSAIERVVRLPWWVAGLFATGFGILFVEPSAMGDATARSLLLAILGVIAALIFSRLLARIPRSGSFFERVSRGTLAIYLVHSLALYSLYLVAQNTGLRVPPGALVDFLFVPLATVFLILVSLGFQDIVRKFRIRGVFAAPWPEKVVRAPATPEPTDH